MRLAGCNHVIVSTFLLQHQPHRLDVLFSVAPVALSLEVSEKGFVLETSFDRSYCARDLARHEGFAAPWAFVIEEDAVAREHAVRLAIVNCRPVGINLGGSIRGTRVKRRSLALWHLGNFPVHLGAARLV